LFFVLARRSRNANGNQVRAIPIRDDHIQAQHKPATLQDDEIAAREILRQKLHMVGGFAEHSSSLHKPVTFRQYDSVERPPQFSAWHRFSGVRELFTTHSPTWFQERREK
jgi:hypothetical protein